MRLSSTGKGAVPGAASASVPRQRTGVIRGWPKPSDRSCAEPGLDVHGHDLEAVRLPLEQPAVRGARERVHRVTRMRLGRLGIWKARRRFAPSRSAQASR